MVKGKNVKKAAGSERKLGLATRVIMKTAFSKQSPLQTLCQAVCELDNAKHALAFSSGCGILGSILMLFKSGDHALFCDDVYGGTRRYTTRVALDHHGISADFVDLTRPIEEIEKDIKPNTRMLWIESPTNPTLKVCDIQALTALASKHGLVTIMDNTFCTAINQSPLLLGADIALNSATKYMGGHSDVVCGTISTNNSTLYKEIKRLQETNGTVAQEFECGLVLKGVKTLRLRQVQHSKNGLALAKFLESHDKVEKVIYPGLQSHPQHDTVQKQMLGHSGMVTFYIKGDLETVKEVISRLKVCICAESLGGVESLCEVPAIMTHGSVPAEERKKLEIFDNMIRVSVGIENTQDLINDFQNALLAVK